MYHWLMAEKDTGEVRYFVADIRLKLLFGSDETDERVLAFGKELLGCAVGGIFSSHTADLAVHDVEVVELQEGAVLVDPNS